MIFLIVKLSEAKYLIAAHKALYDGERVMETAVLVEKTASAVTDVNMAQKKA